MTFSRKSCRLWNWSQTGHRWKHGACASSAGKLRLQTHTEIRNTACPQQQLLRYRYIERLVLTNLIVYLSNTCYILFRNSEASCTKQILQPIHHRIYKRQQQKQGTDVHYTATACILLTPLAIHRVTHFQNISDTFRREPSSATWDTTALSLVMHCSTWMGNVRERMDIYATSPSLYVTAAATTDILIHTQHS
jgi:hypothetical protein